MTVRRIRPLDYAFELEPKEEKMEVKQTVQSDNRPINYFYTPAIYAGQQQTQRQFGFGILANILSAIMEYRREVMSIRQEFLKRLSRGG